MQNTYIYHTRKIAENLFPHINDPIKSSAYDQEGGGNQRGIESKQEMMLNLKVEAQHSEIK